MHTSTPDFWALLRATRLRWSSTLFHYDQTDRSMRATDNNILQSQEGIWTITCFEGLLGFEGLFVQVLRMCVRPGLESDFLSFLNRTLRHVRRQQDG